MKIDVPNTTQVVDEYRLATPAWMSFLLKVQMFITANSLSGTTVQRPTKGLSPGDKYMDTTLGYIVHVRSVNPVVWVRWDGTVV
jgi:hypothetical protein